MIIFLVANGRVRNLRRLCEYLRPSLVIAVNGGANKSIKDSIYPDIVIGDGDSLRRKIKSKVIKFPKEKDRSDLDLAVDYILKNFEDPKLFCFGIIGNRIDHTFANIYSLSRIKNYPPVIITSNETIYIMNLGHSISNIDNGTKVSILSLAYDFSIVEILGLKYSGIFEIPLLSSLGISNYVTDQNNTVRCLEGLIAVIIYRNYLKLKGINVEG